MFVDIHVIQSVPPSNINRDDTGSPQDRLLRRRPPLTSEQPGMEKAVRSTFVDNVVQDGLGVRTKQAVEKLVERMKTHDPDLDAAEAQRRASRSSKRWG